MGGGSSNSSLRGMLGLKKLTRAKRPLRLALQTPSSRRGLSDGVNARIAVTRLQRYRGRGFALSSLTLLVSAMCKGKRSDAVTSEDRPTEFVRDGGTEKHSQLEADL